jgi:hypothetical protein
MMFPCRAVAAFAAVVLTLVLATAPVASARAMQPTAVTPQVQQTLDAAAHSKAVKKSGLVPGVTPGSPICVLLLRQIQFALAIGNPILANLLSRTFIILGCGGAAI